MFHLFAAMFKRLNDKFILGPLSLRGDDKIRETAFRTATGTANGRTNDLLKINSWLN